MAFCTNCGAEQQGGKFCSECGTPQGAGVAAASVPVSVEEHAPPRMDEDEATV